MAEKKTDWEIPADVRPRPEDFTFDLDRALNAVLRLEATVPQDAFSASTLGTERAGNAVLIKENGLVLTIGYLMSEADSIWLYSNEGQALAGHALAYDYETGFGLVQALGRFDAPPLQIGSAADLAVGEPVIVGGAGGRRRSISAQVMVRREFAGYWEYLLDEALFTAPAHPNWGGAALIARDGALAGIGSLFVQQSVDGGPAQDLNMIVPIDALKPILKDLLAYGRVPRPARPWLGIYAAETEGRVVVVGLSPRGPAQQVGIRKGDVILTVGDQEVTSLAELYRQVWALGAAGVEVPLTLARDERPRLAAVKSADRSQFMKTPRLPQA
ncbi:MAG TPA: S1C family serine protease [Stellaceae bacterium]|jgi:S1-C subfamily serine protease|nr:S1C family serine protease [Stellaceae bacterium]